MTRVGRLIAPRGMRARMVGVLALLLAALGAGVATPAAACACGAYFTTDGAKVADETAALRWDGTTEDLIVSLDVLGSSPDAAIVIPVPAEAQVAAGDIRLLDELAQRTKPREERTTSWWPNLDFIDKLHIGSDDGGANAGAATPTPTVTVLDQRVLGELTVAQIAAADTEALRTWLSDNGYSLPDAVTAAMAPYASANWVFVAVKITAPDPAKPFTGRLQPLELTFPSPQPIYPMRLSQAATTPQSITLYVVAADRMEAEFTPVPGTAPTLMYAGEVDPANMGASSRIGRWVGTKSYLVRYDQVINDPSMITSDFTFGQAPTNEAYQTVIHTERDMGWLTGGLLSVLFLVLLAVVPTRILYVRRVRRERAEYGV
jgi:hypothetical protein